MRLTKAERRQIVEDFTRRHNGIFNPELFVEEVKAAGSSHPAYAYFEWDKDTAAWNYVVQQAREFVRDLRISFKVQEVDGSGGSFNIKYTEAPMLISPVDGRSTGGGYFLIEPNNPDHMMELCRQASTALKSWLKRYGAAVAYIGGDIEGITEMVGLLDVDAKVEEDA